MRDPIRLMASTCPKLCLGLAAALLAAGCALSYTDRSRPDMVGVFANKLEGFADSGMVVDSNDTVFVSLGVVPIIGHGGYNRWTGRYRVAFFDPLGHDDTSITFHFDAKERAYDLVGIADQRARAIGRQGHFMFITNTVPEELAKEFRRFNSPEMQNEIRARRDLEQRLRKERQATDHR